MVRHWAAWPIPKTARTVSRSDLAECFMRPNLCSLLHVGEVALHRITTALVRNVWVDTNRMRNKLRAAARGKIGMRRTGRTYLMTGLVVLGAVCRWLREQQLQ